MKKVIGLLFAVVLAVQSSGCCTILNSIRGQAAGGPKYRWECHLVGNLFSWGPIGLLVDLATGAHMGPAYDSGAHLPDGDPNKFYALYLSNGTVMVLKDVHEPTPEELKKARRLPQGVSVVKTEWVMRKAGS